MLSVDSSLGDLLSVEGETPLSLDSNESFITSSNKSAILQSLLGGKTESAVR